MECGDTLHSIISIWTQKWLLVCILSLLHTLDIKNRPIQNWYYIIYHNSRILNIKSLNFEM